MIDVGRWGARLERQGPRGIWARSLAAAWAPLAGWTLVRRLALPDGVRAVAIGGATLGGSGKTPLAVACALEVARGGASVAVVGHGYRAAPSRARWVGPGDHVKDVGDEALEAARSLLGTEARVVVAPSRAAATRFAAKAARVLVLDGVAQTAPVRAHLSLLAVDALRPWGSGALPPCGDLRALPAALERAADGAVAIVDPYAEPPRAWCRWTALVRSAGARVGAQLHPWAELAGRRVGLLSAIARRERLLHFLAARGVHPRFVVRARDHGPFDRAELGLAAQAEVDERIDLWLATPKCRTHLEHVAPGTGALSAPLAVIDHALDLCGELRACLRAVAEEARTRRFPAPVGAVSRGEALLDHGCQEQ